jgi:hypothetical protein
MVACRTQQMELFTTKFIVSPLTRVIFNLYLFNTEKLYDARSLNNLLKSLFEYKRIKLLYAAVPNRDKFTSVMNIGSRSFHMIHWIFDNLFILIKVLNMDKDLKVNSP